MNLRNFSFAGLVLILTGCAALFGWDIHAPGILSEGFTQNVQPSKARIALYYPKELLSYISTDRGGKTADPQNYHVGEAYGPMVVEAFQTAFDEFIFLETEPSKDLMTQYAIPMLVTASIKGFNNEVSWSGQKITLMTEISVYNTQLDLIDRFESTGSSDVKRVFSKKGGPQVNLNLALENNIMSTIERIQDILKKSDENS